MIVLWLMILLGGVEIPGEVIYPEAVEALWWSPDSERLIFYAPSPSSAYIPMAVSVDEPVWYSYDVNTAAVSSGNTWPLQPDFTDAELAQLEPVTNAFFFPSPDGSRVLYLWKEDDNDNPLYELAMWHGSAFTPTGIQIENEPLPDLRQFHVVWSADGSTFTVTHNCCVYAPTVQIDYMQVGALTGAMLDFTPLAAGRQFYTGGVHPIADHNNVHDLSDDGERVLLSAWEVDASTPGVLLIWQPDAPTASVIFDDVDVSMLIAASFAPGDESRLLLMEETRLLCYDTTTNALVNEAPLTGRNFVGLFSPDGRWLVYQNDDGVWLADMTDFCAT